MHFYRVRVAEQPGSTQFVGTFNELRAWTKTFLQDKVAAMDIEVHLIDVPVDKKGVLILLNQDPLRLDFPVLRTWEVTDRGGLKETMEP